MSINLVLAYALILVRGWIGIELLRAARRNRLPTLNWLALHFLVIIVGVLFSPASWNPLGSTRFSIALFVLSAGFLPQMMLITFNHKTYYQNRTSPAIWFWAASTLGFLVSMYGAYSSPSTAQVSAFTSAYTVSSIIMWIWHAALAYQTLHSLESDEVEDWVTSRYRLMIAYSAVIALGTFSLFIRIFIAGDDPTSTFAKTVELIALLAQIITSGLQFLTWVMPERFRAWLNRNYHARMKGRIYEKAIAILDIIGTAMTQETGLSKMIAMFAIRKMIGEKFGAETSAAIETHAIGMNYHAWLDLLQNPALHILIKNSAINVNADLAIENAKRALVENQSLFTMQAK